MRIILILLFGFGYLSFVQAQITLEYCQEKARENYPLIKRYSLIEETQKITIGQIHKAYLPQLSLNGKASWQSDVTEFPGSFSDMLDQMGVDISFPGKDQYNIGLELSQVVWDGGITASQKKSIKAQTEIDRRNVDVNLYALKEQVNQLFFSVLLLEEQREQNSLLLEELGRNYALISSYEENGLAQQSDLDEIMVEILSARQREIEMKTSKKSLIKVLGTFIGESIGEEVYFIKPDAAWNSENDVSRPELKLFTSQISLFEVEENQLWSKGMPRIALFAQGAYGNPGLNMFKSGFTPYFMGGIQFSWNFGGLYTYSDEKRLLETRKRQVEIQKEIFLFNTRQKIDEKNSEIEKLKALLESDDEIIRLRESVLKSSEAKVENGTMSVSDLMKNIYAATMARQTRSYREIQLLLAIWQLKTEQGIE